MGTGRRRDIHNYRAQVWSVIVGFAAGPEGVEDVVRGSRGGYWKNGDKLGGRKTKQPRT